MAGKKTKVVATQGLDKAMDRHVFSLHCRTLDNYVKWCKENGFNPSLNKSESQRRNEYSYYVDKGVVEKLKAHKKLKKRAAQIRQLYEKEPEFIDTADNFTSTLNSGFRRSRDPKLLLESLLYIELVSDLLEDDDYIEGLVSLCGQWNKWRQPLNQWRPRSHNRDRQFADLLRYLMVKYPVPAFMDEAWRKVNKLHQHWFMHIGEGHNIRTAEKLPIQMTKKMAHYFLLAPDHCTIKAAMRWAQVLALGGSKQLAEAILATRLSTSFVAEDFWLSVIRLFINSPMLDRAQINPIVDYLWQQRCENQVVHHENVEAEVLAPAQPNMSMQGRTVVSLLRQVHNWHRQLGRESRGGDLRWQQIRINGFVFKEGNEKQKNSKTWRVRELCTSKELTSEGRAMQHCVASYARSCVAGRTSIWTLEMEDKMGMTKMLTVEVTLSNKQIVQARGLRNRIATEKEKSILRRWAQQELLQFCTYF